MIRNIFIAIVFLILLSLSIFFIQMYPFAKGVTDNTRKRSNDYNSAHFLMDETELPNLEHLMPQLLISNDIVAIEICSEHGKLINE